MSIFALWVPYFNIGIREMSATTFFLTGHYYKKTGWHLEIHKWLIPVTALVVLVGALFYPSNMLSLTRLYIIPYTFFALSGTLMVFSFSKWISSSVFFSKLLVYIGNNTLTILTWHFLCFKVVSLVIIYFNDLQIQKLAEFPVIDGYAQQGWWILYFLVGVLVPLLFTKSKILR